MPSEARAIAIEPYVIAMERLVAAVQDLSKARELGEILSIVPRAARELVGADGAAIVLSDHGVCFHAAEDAVTPGWRGKHWPVEACVSGWVVQKREPAIVWDASHDLRVADACRGTSVRSLAALPIRASDPIGAIEVYWLQNHRATEAELRLLTSLAEATSNALENVSLYAELRRAIEEASVARASAERASQLKTAFLAMMSHELRTPLGSLSLTLERVVDQFAQPGAADDPALIDRMRASTERLSGVIETLLEQARVESGRLSLHPADIDPVRAAEEAIEGERTAARKKGLKIVLETAPDLPRLSSDPRLVRVVLSNLVDNAVKFTERGSVIVRVTREGDRIAFRVIDTGPGISKLDRLRIFEPFETLEPIQRKHTAGVGLGLALVDSIATALGGTIQLESTVGAGSTFTLTLPA
jgi:signal transduction histidine kinase